MCEVTRLVARHCPVASPGCRSLREPQTVLRSLGRRKVGRWRKREEGAQGGAGGRHLSRQYGLGLPPLLRYCVTNCVTRYCVTVLLRHCVTCYSNAYVGGQIGQ
eukprot:2673870-Prymnesium_polylepis.1